jgi:high-affinity Fe2+/Pb2+ permease
MKKILDVLKVGLKAIGKFLRYTYASQITIGALAVLIGLTLSKFLGVVIFVWGILLFINEFKQNSEVK